jgi:hypothetical protein
MARAGGSKDEGDASAIQVREDPLLAQKAGSSEKVGKMRCFPIKT